MVNIEGVKLEIEEWEEVTTTLNGKCKLFENYNNLIGFGKGEGKVYLEQATKAQMGTRCIAVLFV